jgi:glutathione S-transferase
VKLELYYTTTTCSLASHLALEEAGADFAAHFVKLYKPEGRDAYLRINPSGKVPALSIDGVMITENVAILNFAARAFPNARLLPDDPIAAARVNELLGWFASVAHLDRRQARVPARFCKDPSTHAALAAEGRARFWSDLQRIDALLDGTEWLVGAQLSLADCYAMVFWAWGCADGHPMAALEGFAALAKRMLARPRRPARAGARAQSAA